MKRFLCLTAFACGVGLGALIYPSPNSSTAQYLHTLVVLAGCDADINVTEPLDVMAPKLAACIAEQRKRLIEFEAVMEQNVGSPVQVKAFSPQPKIAPCPCDDREYWRNLTRDGVFPRTEHGE